MSDAIERVFSSADALNSSFIAPSERRDRERSDGVGEDDGGDDDSLSSEETNPPLDPATRRVRDALKLDFDELLDVYQAIESLGSLFVGILLASFARLLESLGDGPTAWSRAGHSLIRLVLIVLECPALIEPRALRRPRVVAQARGVAPGWREGRVRALRPGVLHARAVHADVGGDAAVCHRQGVRLSTRNIRCVDVAVEHASSFLRVLWRANAAVVGGGVPRGVPRGMPRECRTRSCRSRTFAWTR